MANEEVRHISVKISLEDIHDGVRNVVRIVRPSWSECPLQVKQFTGGVTNLLLGCHPERCKADDMLLVRLYGENSDLVTDRALEVRNISMLHRHGCAEPVYATFTNGMVYGFAPGRPLTRDDVPMEMFSALVAAHMARLHQIKPPANCASIKPSVLTNLRSWLDRLPSKFTNEKTQQSYEAELPPRQLLAAEVDELCCLLPEVHSPVVFCHNDTTAGNIIYRQDNETVTFVDHEYGGFNYRGFDIGNHFCEFAGVEKMDFSLFPNRETQLSWLRQYATSFNQLAGVTKDVTEEDLEQLYVEVNIFSLASNLQWTMWGLLQAEHSLIDFDYIDYAKIRYAEYCRRKAEVLSLFRKSGKNASV